MTKFDQPDQIVKKDQYNADIIIINGKEHIKNDNPPPVVVKLWFRGRYYVFDMDLQVFFDKRKVGVGTWKKGFDFVVGTTIGKHEITIEALSSIGQNLNELNMTIMGATNTLVVNFEDEGNYEVQINNSRFTTGWNVEKIHNLAS